MVTKKMAEELADLFEVIRHEGILVLEDSEYESVVFNNLDEEERLYFKTVAAAFSSGSFDVDELQIINRNAGLKCKNQNVLLSTFFDLLLLYWKNCSDKKMQRALNKNPKKLKDVTPTALNVRQILRLMANGDSSKCEYVLNKIILEQIIEPDWMIIEKLQNNS